MPAAYPIIPIWTNKCYFSRGSIIKHNSTSYSLFESYGFFSHRYFFFQNEASTMWVNGPGSRTMSALPGSTYYIFPGNNQHGSIRQSQQPSHYDYGASGYPNFYHSQTGVSQEHQPPRDGTVKASQGPPSQQCHQIWQNSYWSAGVSLSVRVLYLKSSRFNIMFTYGLIKIFIAF